MKRVSGGAVAMVAAGTLLIVGGLLALFYESTLKKVDGTVTAVSSQYFSSRGGGHDEWFPTVKYEVANTSYSFTPPTEEQAGLKREVTVGETIALRYDPESPDQAYFASSHDGQVVAGGMVVIGLAAIVCALWPKRREQPPTPSG